MRDDREKLQDMLEAIERIERYVIFGRERFESDELVQIWFIQHLQIIGEASRTLSQSVKDLAPTISWKQMIGMRNILTHAYFDIDLEIVWNAVSIGIPDLKLQLKILLTRLPNE